MMIEETIVSVGSQAFMTTQKLPYKIKRRLPGAPDVGDAHSPAHRRELLRTDGFGDDFIVHRRFPLSFHSRVLRLDIFVETGALVKTFGAREGAERAIA
jgi:hypothetical protein